MIFFIVIQIFFMRKQKNLKFIKIINYQKGKYFNNLSRDYFIIISGVIFRRDTFTKYGMFNESYNIIGDYEFYNENFSILQGSPLTYHY